MNLQSSCELSTASAQRAESAVSSRKVFQLRTPYSKTQLLLSFYCTRTSNRADLKRSSCSERLIEGVGGARELVEKNANAEASAKQKEATLFGTIRGVVRDTSQNHLSLCTSGSNQWYLYIRIRCRALALVAPAELLMNPQRLLVMNSLLPTIAQHCTFTCAHCSILNKLSL